jgi:hypothetical protein
LEKWDTIFNDRHSYRYSFSEGYAKGLGIIDQYRGGFETSSSKSLKGYIKGIDTFGIITSIPENILFKTDYHIYPNPVKNNLYIKLDDSINLINIYNINGILINSIPIKNRNSNIVTIDLRDFCRGLYLIEIRGKIRYIEKFEKL